MFDQNITSNGFPPLDVEKVREAGGELMTPLDPLHLARLPHNDSGNAARFKLRFADRFRYVPEQGWYAFTGTHWSAEEGQSRATRAARDVAELIRDEAEALRRTDPKSGLASALHRFSTRSGNAHTIASMLRIAQVDLEASLDEFDVDPLAVNCPNGTVRFFQDERGTWLARLDPHSSKDLISRITHAEYLPNHRSQLWEDHLKRMLPEIEEREYIRRVFGYALLGLCKEQAFFVFQGRGGDGKSTTVNTIRRVMGSYANAADVRTFLASRDPSGGGGDKASPALARLAGDIRLVSTSEPPKGAQLNEGLVKGATGGAPITARHLKRDLFEYIPRWKLIMECNSLPYIPGEDDGIWRRAKLVPWRVQLKRHQMNPDLEKELSAESVGVLSWLVSGALDYLNNGLNEPDCVRQALSDFRRGSNVFGEWLSECCEIDAQKSETQKSLYASFTTFCEKCGEAPVGNRGFGKMLSSHQIITRDGPGGRTPDKARDLLRFGARLKPHEDMETGAREASELETV